MQPIFVRMTRTGRLRKMDGQSSPVGNAICLGPEDGISEYHVDALVGTVERRVWKGIIDLASDGPVFDAVFAGRGSDLRPKRTFSVKPSVKFYRKKALVAKRCEKEHKVCIRKGRGRGRDCMHLHK